MAEGIVRLNLGCGAKHWAGFTNVDFAANASGKKPDVEADLRSLPFPDNYADEAHAIHVIEHFYPWETQGVLKEWKRVLKPKGVLVLELPCLEKIIGHLNHDVVDMRMTWWGLYGDPKYKDPNMMHRWAYSVRMMEDALTEAGFENIQHGDPVFHKKERDMRFEAQKPCS